jgi:hypothetical protein
MTNDFICHINSRGVFPFGMLQIVRLYCKIRLRLMSKRFVSGERCVTDILFHSTDSKRYCGRVSTVNDVGLGSRLKI